MIGKILFAFGFTTIVLAILVATWPEINLLHAALMLYGMCGCSTGLWIGD